MITSALLVAAVAAGAEEMDAGEQLVHRFVTDIVTLRADFEQSLTDADGQVVERTSGTLEIARPDRFRWSYIEPYEQWLIADGTNVWSYDIDLEQVTVKPQAEALANTPALLLGGSDSALEQFQYRGSFDDNGLRWVRLVPTNTDSGFESVELGFVDEQLERMVFFDNLEQITRVVLSDVSVNEPADEGRFEFTVPDGVDVVGVPAVATTQEP